MSELRFYSGYQFSLVRILLGLYVCLYLVPLIPHAAEIYSNQGMLPDPTFNLDYGYFPNILYWFDGPQFCTAFVGLLCVLALLVAVGFRRLPGVLLWYGWACLFSRNNYTGNPAIPTVGWLLLAVALPPLGEPLSLHKKRSENWSLSPHLFWGAWFVMGLSYSISGLFKLASPSWVDGTAAYHTLQMSSARESIVTRLVENAPHGFIEFFTWSTLGIEVLFLPLCIWSITRPIAFWGMVFVHFGLISMFIFPQLTAGVLILHLFTLDARWLPALRKSSNPGVLYFDGVCGLCNRTVDFLVKEDWRETLRFSPLQGEHAAQHLPKEDTQDLDSLVLVENDRRYYRSTAVIRALAGAGGIWLTAWILLLIPRPIRDVTYRFIAMNRYRLFGKRDSCRVPTPDERSRFLE